jgi:hypothetical protein
MPDLGPLDVGASRDGVDRERGCRDGGPDDDYVAGAVREPGDGRLAQRDSPCGSPPGSSRRSGAPLPHSSWPRSNLPSVLGYV